MDDLPVILMKNCIALLPGGQLLFNSLGIGSSADVLTFSIQAEQRARMKIFGTICFHHHDILFIVSMPLVHRSVRKYNEEVCSRKLSIFTQPS